MFVGLQEKLARVEKNVLSKKEQISKCHLLFEALSTLLHSEQN